MLNAGLVLLRLVEDSHLTDMRLVTFRTRLETLRQPFSRTVGSLAASVQEAFTTSE